MRIANIEIPKTTFSIRHGHYEFVVIYFVPTDALATFMNIMNDVFKDNTDQFAMVYRDNILIYNNHGKNIYEMSISCLIDDASKRCMLNYENLSLASKKSITPDL